MGKRLICVLVSILLVLTLCLPTFAAIEIRDVPTGHWSYTAIQKLLDKGYLSLYQDKTFRGENPVDRFTFAVVVARLISEMAAITPVSEPSQATGKQDQELLKQLTTEFRDELVQLATVDESLRNNLVAVSKETTVLREDLNKILVQVYQLQQSITALAATTDELGARLDTLETSHATDVENLAAKVNELNSNVNQLSSADKELGDKITALETKVDEEVLTRASGTFVRQQSMEKDLQRLAQEFDSYRRNSEAEIADLQTKNQWLTMGVIAGVLLSIVVK